MAVAFVQATAEARSSVAVLALTTAAFGAQPVVGNFIVMVVWFAQGGTDPTSFTFTDNQAAGGNTYATAAMGPNIAGSGRCAIGIARITKSSGAFTVTATVANQGFCAGQAWEVSGLKSVANPTDQTNTAGPTTSTTAASGSVTPSEANEFIVAAFVDSLVANNAISAPSGAGWVGQVEEEDGGTFAQGAGAYRIAAAIQAESTTWTITSADWGGAIASFKSEPDAGSDTRFASGRTIYKLAPQRWG
jgi:hypothetical protein